MMDDHGGPGRGESIPKPGFCGALGLDYQPFQNDDPKVGQHSIVNSPKTTFF